MILSNRQAEKSALNVFNKLAAREREREREGEMASKGLSGCVRVCARLLVSLENLTLSL